MLVQKKAERSVTYLLLINVLKMKKIYISMQKLWERQKQLVICLALYIIYCWKSFSCFSPKPFKVWHCGAFSMILQWDQLSLGHNFGHFFLPAFVYISAKFSRLMLCLFCSSLLSSLLPMVWFCVQVCVAVGAIVGMAFSLGTWLFRAPVRNLLISGCLKAEAGRVLDTTSFC